jgi:hypothetical protein
MTTRSGKDFRKGEPHRFLAGHHTATRREPSRIITIEGVECRTIPLNNGMEAVVDIPDFEFLSQWHWMAKTVRGNTYPCRAFWENGRRVHRKMHQELIVVPDGYLPDHQNNNGLDNRRLNLRLATTSQNCQNTSLRSDNTSGYKGVSLHRQSGKWGVRIRIGRTYRRLGLFVDPVDAARAYDVAAREFFGEFARCNFSQ